MAYTTINKPTDYFNTLIYTGNGGNAHAITGVGFKPDWVWTKNRNHAADHYVHDIVRGVEKAIRPNVASGTYDTSINLQSFDTDGFTVGTQDGLNKSGDSIVSWNWLAGGSAGSSNTDGSINTTSTSVNTTAGFSISTYTGTGSVATIGHGLGAVPNVVLVKRLDNSSDWRMYHSGAGAGSPATKQLFLNGTGVQDDDNTIWNDTAPTSSVFTVGTNTGGNASGGTYVAYCFTEKVGYSSFGDYTGNASADGTFVYTGFKPAFLLSKNASATQGWFLIDNKRANPYNPVDGSLHPNASAVEDTSSDFFVDFTSNGFKVRDTDAQLNASGNVYIYMAFAEAPLVGTNNIPVTAR